MRIHRYESISVEVLQNTEDVPEKLWLLSNHAPKKVLQLCRPLPCISHGELSQPVYIYTDIIHVLYISLDLILDLVDLNG